VNLNNNKNHILRLFPAPTKSRPLNGLYLNEPLRPAGTPSQPFVYATFIVSLDGRISLLDSETDRKGPPPAITNPRDWRLMQELAASADVVVISGRYIRDLADGVAQDNLPVSNKPEFADLLEWRRQHNLAQQPAVTIVTDTLDLPIPKALLRSGRPIYVATGDNAKQSRVETLKEQGAQVLKTGSGARVNGRKLITTLAKEGFGNIFMTAGGELLNTLLVDGVFERLYLTQAFRILGGKSFDTMLKGQQFDPPPDFKLRSLYYDDGNNNAIGQLFSVFDCQK